MATLVGNVNSSVTEWTVSAAITHDIDYLSIDSETVQVLTHTPIQLDPQTRVALPPKIRVRRGSGGTTAASHLSGATLTPLIPPSAAGGGAGGLTVDNTVDPPFDVSTLVAAGATESAPDEATLAAGGGELLSATVELDDAQIKALGADSEVELVATPGAGKINRLWALDFIYSGAAAPYGVGVDRLLTVQYAGGAEIAYIPDDAGEGLTQLTDLLGVAPVALHALPYWQMSPGFGAYFPVLGTASEVNRAIELTGGSSGAFTGGNAAATLTVTTYYTVVDLP